MPDSVPQNAWPARTRERRGGFRHNRANVIDRTRVPGWLLVVGAMWMFAAAPLAADAVLIGRNVDESVEASLELLPRDDVASVEDASRIRGWLPASEVTTREGAIWGRLRVDAVSAAKGLWLLEADHAWELVELFTREGGRWRVIRTGQSIPVAELPVDHPRAFLPIESEALSRPGSDVVYLRFVQPAGKYGRPAGFLKRMGPAMEILAAERRSAMFDGAFSGVAFAMAVYNLFLYFALRDRARLWYTLYVVAFGLFWLVGRGVLAELFWPGFPGRGYALDFILICASVIFGTMFAREFLEVSENAPRLTRALDAVTGTAIVALILGAAGIWPLAENVAALGALAGFVVYIVAGAVVMRRGFTPARYFLAAWSILACGGVPYILAYFGLVPVNSFVRNGPRIAAAAEMLLLAFALGYRIRVLEKEHRDAQELYTRRLEVEIGDRTSALEAANESLRELNVRLKELSLQDELTGIANRRLFDLTLDEEWRRAARNGAPLSVILGDVDHFKRYNDWYGHQRGDECLRRVAESLAGASRRAGELVARYGGEEFGVVLPGVPREDAVRRAEEMRQGVEESAIRHAASPASSVVTISFGVATREPTMDDLPSSILESADRALYRAKARGRNCVETG